MWVAVENKLHKQNLDNISKYDENYFKFVQGGNRILLVMRASESQDYPAALNEKFTDRMAVTV